MAQISVGLNSALGPIAPKLLDRHFLRKHGSGAYYGQASGSPSPEKAGPATSEQGRLGFL